MSVLEISRVDCIKVPKQQKKFKSAKFQKNVCHTENS